MKRLRNDPLHAAALSLLDQSGTAINESTIAELAKSADALRRNPIVIHGRRAEKMFGFVAASLRHCIVIKEEDCGETYTVTAEIQPPDYKLALQDGTSLYVEVKNHHKVAGLFSIKEVYLKKLRSYCRAFPGKLRIAVYWSRWNKWVLIDPERIPLGKTRRVISFFESLKINEMAVLGDMTPATRPPLTMRFLSDPMKPRAVAPNGEAPFTIGGVEFYCGGRKLEDPQEKNWAYYFMLFGGWHSVKPTHHVENGQLIYTELICQPEERVPNQGFELLDPISSMISRRYQWSTSDDDGITRLVPEYEPEKLSIEMPQNYKGKDLPLWQFILQPSSDPVKREGPEHSP